MTPCLIIRCHQELTMIHPYYHCSRMLNYQKKSPWLTLYPLSTWSRILKLPFSYGFPISLWFSYGFPMVSLWFSYGFPMVSFSFSFGKPLSPSPRAPCPGHRPKYSAARPRNQRCNPSAAPADGHRDRDRQVFTRCLVCKGSCWVVNHYWNLD